MGTLNIGRKETAGPVNAAMLNTIYTATVTARRDTAAWVKKYMGDLDLNDHTKDNIARIEQRKTELIEKWNEKGRVNGKMVFINRPKSVNTLESSVRGKTTASTRVKQTLSNIPVPFLNPKATGRLFTGKWFTELNSGRPYLYGGNPYQFLDQMDSFTKDVELVKRGRSFSDVDAKGFSKRWGMDLYNPPGTTSNSYFDRNLDRSTSTRDLDELYQKRAIYKKDFPLHYAISPDGHLSQLNVDSQFYVKPKNTSRDPLSPKKIGEYYGKIDQGLERWTGRGSGRSQGQANADTKAMLLQMGANPVAVKHLNNRALSRLRISGFTTQSANRVTFGSMDNRVTLKLNPNGWKPSTRRGGGNINNNEPNKITYTSDNINLEPFPKTTKKEVVKQETVPNENESKGLFEKGGWFRNEQGEFDPGGKDNRLGNSFSSPNSLTIPKNRKKNNSLTIASPLDMDY